MDGGDKPKSRRDSRRLSVFVRELMKTKDDEDEGGSKSSGSLSEEEKEKERGVGEEPRDIRPGAISSRQSESTMTRISSRRMSHNSSSNQAIHDGETKSKSSFFNPKSNPTGGSGRLRVISDDSGQSLVVPRSIVEGEGGDDGEGDGDGEEGSGGDGGDSDGNGEDGGLAYGDDPEADEVEAGIVVDKNIFGEEEIIDEDDDGEHKESGDQGDAVLRLERARRTSTADDSGSEASSVGRRRGRAGSQSTLSPILEHEVKMGPSSVKRRSSTSSENGAAAKAKGKKRPSMTGDGDSVASSSKGSVVKKLKAKRKSIDEASIASSKASSKGGKVKRASISISGGGVGGVKRTSSFTTPSAVGKAGIGPSSKRNSIADPIGATVSRKRASIVGADLSASIGRRRSESAGGASLGGLSVESKKTINSVKASVKAPATSATTAASLRRSSVSSTGSEALAREKERLKELLKKKPEPKKPLRKYSLDITDKESVESAGKKSIRVKIPGALHDSKGHPSSSPKANHPSSPTATDSHSHLHRARGGHGHGNGGDGEAGAFLHSSGGFLKQAPTFKNLHQYLHDVRHFLTSSLTTGQSPSNQSEDFMDLNYGDNGYDPADDGGEYINSSAVPPPPRLLSMKDEIIKAITDGFSLLKRNDAIDRNLHLQIADLGKENIVNPALDPAAVADKWRLESGGPFNELAAKLLHKTSIGISGEGATVPVSSSKYDTTAPSLIYPHPTNLANGSTPLSMYSG